MRDPGLAQEIKSAGCIQLQHVGSWNRKLTVALEHRNIFFTSFFLTYFNSAEVQGTVTATHKRSQFAACNASLKKRLSA